MNIAFITPKMIIGGAETYIITKATYLCSQGYRVLVISAGGENIKHLPSCATHITLNTDITPYHLSKKQFNQTIDKIAQVLLDYQIDVVEAHNTYPILYASIACRKTNIPCLYNMLNELSHRKQLLTNILIKTFSGAQCYFTLTKQMNEFVEKQIHTVLHPIIIPIPVAAVSEPQNNEAHNYILSVCRFSADKMYVLSLMQGFVQAITTGAIPQDTILKIVGDGDLHQKVTIQAQKSNEQIGHNAVELLGTQVGSNLDNLFRHCTIYVGMGTTILIAAQYKKPILKVGFESHTRANCWGYWGDSPSDANSIVANSNSNQPISFANALKIINFEEKLQIAGDKAYKTYYANYLFEAIMEQWQSEYSRIQTQRYILPQAIINKLQGKLYYLRLIKNIQRLIKR